MVLNYRNTNEFIANYRCAVDGFHESRDFHLQDVYKMLKTEQKSPQLPYQRPDIVKYQILCSPLDG